MLLYSSPLCIDCHRVRLVLAEKGVEYELVEFDALEAPEDLWDLNPYGDAPTLVERELVLYDARVIMEYLNERFPYPALLPPEPAARARFRLALSRIEKDWYRLLPGVAAGKPQARRELSEGLIASSRLFAAKAFFLSEQFSLIDCSLAPLLWRLSYYAIVLPPPARAIVDYAERLFARASFKRSLSEAERALRSEKFLS